MHLLTLWAQEKRLVLLAGAAVSPCRQTGLSTQKPRFPPGVTAAPRMPQRAQARVHVSQGRKQEVVSSLRLFGVKKVECLFRF